MRLLHTADWHLGRVLLGQSLLEDQVHVLDELVALVRDARPDAVLVSGDVFDRAVPPADAVEILDEVLTRIVLDGETTVIAIGGNHDSAGRLGFGSRLLARSGLHVVGGVGSGLPRPIGLRDEHGPIHLVPIPYAAPVEVRALLGCEEIRDHDSALEALASAIELPPGERVVALAHAFVVGGVESESERPLSVGGTGAVDLARFAPFCYAALGHLHRPQSLADGRARYAGSLLKYSFSEIDHEKSVTLVEIGAEGEVTLEALPLAPRHDLRAIEGALSDLLERPDPDLPRDDYLLVRLADRGPLLDVVARLREVYPKVLAVERPHLSPADAGRLTSAEQRRMTETELFGAFFSQVTGEELSEAERGQLEQSIEELALEEREARS